VLKKPVAATLAPAAGPAPPADARNARAPVLPPQKKEAAR